MEHEEMGWKIRFFSRVSQSKLYNKFDCPSNGFWTQCSFHLVENLSTGFQKCLITPGDPAAKPPWGLILIGALITIQSEFFITR